MKTTIDIADDLLARAKQKAHEQHSTLREVVEQGLRVALSDVEAQLHTIEPVTFKGRQPAFKDAPWRAVRDAAYGMEER